MVAGGGSIWWFQVLLGSVFRWFQEVLPGGGFRWFKVVSGLFRQFQVVVSDGSIWLQVVVPRGFKCF